jgi:hypothetical protein
VRRRGVGVSAIPRLEEVAVLALAAARLARAISIDEIMAPARQRMEGWADQASTPNWRKWSLELVRCPVCIGWWTSLAISLAAPGRHRLLRGVSVAGLQVLLALAERLISEEGRAAVYVAEQAAAQSPRTAA